MIKDYFRTSAKLARTFQSKPRLYSMPKASTKAKTATTTKPYEKPKPNKDPKASHLYTDDNPSTTLHGTGFKDAATARHTIEIVSQRSLTYQWQVINTMYYRAKHHPARKKYELNPKSDKAASQGETFQEAMEILEKWLKHDYPEAKKRKREEGKEFKPLLKKETVKKYLDRVNRLDGFDEGKRFAELYAEYPKGKRLANVLVEDGKPEGRDWEILREIELGKLVDERQAAGQKGEEGLWDEKKGGCSDWHLRCVGWAWSPVGERRLPP